MKKGSYFMFNLIGLLLLVAAYLTTLGPTLTVLEEYVNLMADNKRLTEKLLDHLNELNAQNSPLFYCLHIIGSVGSLNLGKGGV